MLSVSYNPFMLSVVMLNVDMLTECCGVVFVSFIQINCMKNYEKLQTVFFTPILQTNFDIIS
jgi:hypothetical protein